MARNGNKVVQYSYHNTQVEGFSPTTGTATWRERRIKKYQATWPEAVTNWKDTYVIIQKLRV